MLDDISPFLRRAGSNRCRSGVLPLSRSNCSIGLVPVTQSDEASQRLHPKRALALAYIPNLIPCPIVLRSSLADSKFKVKPAESGTLAPSRRQSPKHRNSGFLGSEAKRLDSILTPPNGIGHQRPLQLSMRLTRSTSGIALCHVRPNERGRFFVCFPCDLRS